MNLPSNFLNINDLECVLNNISKPIILLEGTRNITQQEYNQLVGFGKFIATKFPNACFRSGNATGSDEAFAEGVRKVAPDRLQIVLPNTNSGKGRMMPLDYKVALNDVPLAEEEVMVFESKKATPANKRLFEAFEKKQEGELKQKSHYLLRDTIKVIGSKANNLEPITIGIFFTNTINPESGGTGHTMRVCRQNSVLVITQDIWLNWIK